MVLNKIEMSFLDKGIVHQYMAIITASIAYFMFGQFMGWPSPTIQIIEANEAPVYLNRNQISWMVSLFFFGNIVMATPGGYLMNYFGPKKTIVYITTLAFTSWLLIIFTKSVPLLYLARFLSGLFGGVISAVQPVYIGEIAQPDIRGRLGTFNNLMITLGMTFMFIIGPYFSYYTLAIISLLPCIVFFVIFSLMPESPYFLILKSKDECRNSLSWLRGDKNQSNLEVELNLIEKTVLEQSKKGSFIDIFATKASRKAFMISQVFSAVKRLSGSIVFQTFATATFPRSTFNILNPSQCIIIISIIEIFGNILTVFVTEKYGRKPLLIISCFGCGVTMLACAIFYYFYLNTHVNVDCLTFIPFVMFSVQTVAYSVGLGTVVAIMKGELFPINVKAKLSALSSLMLSAVLFLMNKYYLEISDDIGLYFNYLIFSVASFFGLFFTLFFLPETRGKTLQEIQDILNRKKLTYLQ